MTDQNNSTENRTNILRTFNGYMAIVGAAVSCSGDPKLKSLGLILAVREGYIVGIVSYLGNPTDDQVRSLIKTVTSGAASYYLGAAVGAAAGAAAGPPVLVTVGAVGAVVVTGYLVSVAFDTLFDPLYDGVINFMNSMANDIDAERYCPTYRRLGKQR